MTAGHIYTVAGNAASCRDGGPAGDGGPATSAPLFDAVDVAFDQAGNLLIADSGQPADRQYAAAAGFAGAGGGGHDGHVLRPADDRGRHLHGGGRPVHSGPRATAGRPPGPGSAPRSGRSGRTGPGTLSWPTAARVTCYGVLAPSVRVIAAVTGTFYGKKMTAGHIYRVAGNGRTGSGGDGGLATRASLALAGSAVRGRCGQPGDRRRHPGARGGGPDGRVLRPADDRRPHLRHRRDRSGRVLRRRRTGPAGPGGSRAGRAGRSRERAAGRRPPGARGGGQVRQLLRAPDDRARHLHRGRERDGVLR